jgi:hypothetical protein
MIKKHMKKDKEGKLSPIQHLTASAEAGKYLTPPLVIKESIHHTS